MLMLKIRGDWLASTCLSINQIKSQKDIQARWNSIFLHKIVSICFKYTFDHKCSTLLLRKISFWINGKRLKFCQCCNPVPNRISEITVRSQSYTISQNFLKVNYIYNNGYHHLRNKSNFFEST